MSESLPSAQELEQARKKIDAILAQGVDAGASDLHLRAGEPPFARINGELQQIDDEVFADDDALLCMVQHLTARLPRRYSEFIENGEADLSYQLADYGRFRVNVFRQRGATALTLRVIPDAVPNLEELSVPDVIRTIAEHERGLVLVTGATGSGKTTTLAAIINHINKTSAKHILTIEDPIEIVHHNLKSLVSQREVGGDTADFGQGLRRALRQDPDVILVGEIRDEETMRTALSAAETGHLVLATLHTIDVTETIARVLDFFPHDAEKQARSMLAGALVGIICQRLVRTKDGGRVAAIEVCVSTGRIVDCIADADETGKIAEAVSQGEYYGMQTFDQALLKHVLAGRITIEEAVRNATSKQNFKLMLEGAGVRSDDDVARIAAQTAAQESARQAEIDAERTALAEAHAAAEAAVAEAPSEGGDAGNAVPESEADPLAAVPLGPDGTPRRRATDHEPPTEVPASTDVASTAPVAAVPAPQLPTAAATGESEPELAFPAEAPSPPAAPAASGPPAAAVAVPVPSLSAAPVPGHPAPAAPAAAPVPVPPPAAVVPMVPPPAVAATPPAVAAPPPAAAAPPAPPAAHVPVPPPVSAAASPPPPASSTPVPPPPPVNVAAPPPAGGSTPPAPTTAPSSTAAAPQSPAGPPVTAPPAPPAQRDAA